MRPRWAAVGSAELYFYADEPHQRAHVDVVGPDWDVKIALDDLTTMDRSGKVPAATLRDAVTLLREHRHLAVEAFQATRAHRFRVRWSSSWRPTMSAEIAPLVRVTDARVLARYIVELKFADGAVKVIDLEPHLWGEMFAPMRADYEVFCQRAVDERAGTIVWPNGADLSPRMLYAEAKSRIPA